MSRGAIVKSKKKKIAFFIMLALFAQALIAAEISPISFNGIASDWGNVYYRNLNIDSSNPLRLEFYRVAAALTYKL